MGFCFLETVILFLFVCLFAVKLDVVQVLLSCKENVSSHVWCNISLHLYYSIYLQIKHKFHTCITSYVENKHKTLH